MNVAGKRIKALRTERGWVLKELAPRAGISISYLSEIERGNVNPSLDTLQAIAGALGVDTQVLIATGSGGVFVTDEQMKVMLRGAQDLGEAEMRDLLQFMDFLRARRTHDHDHE